MIRIHFSPGPPTSPENQGPLALQSEYMWHPPNGLSIDFVVKSVPEPKITRIISTGKDGR